MAEARLERADGEELSVPVGIAESRLRAAIARVGYTRDSASGQMASAQASTLSAESAVRSAQDARESSRAIVASRRAALSAAQAELERATAAWDRAKQELTRQAALVVALGALVWLDRQRAGPVPQPA